MPSVSSAALQLQIALLLEGKGQVGDLPQEADCL